MNSMRMSVLWKSDCENIENDLQCAVRREGAAVLSIKVPVFTLGNSQCPLPWDYADEVDTMKFLFELS